MTTYTVQLALIWLDLAQEPQHVVGCVHQGSRSAHIEVDSKVCTVNRTANALSITCGMLL